MERLFTAFRLLLAPVRGALIWCGADGHGVRHGHRHRRRGGDRARHHGLPIMIKSGYDAKLSAGTITAGGTLGILIPPSVMLIVMGPVLGVSVADLYAAAFGLGFLLAGIYILYLMGRSIWNPKLGPPVPKEERVHLLLEPWPARWRSRPCPARPDLGDVGIHSGRSGHANGSGGHRHRRRPGAGVGVPRFPARWLAAGPNSTMAVQHGAAAGRHLQHLRRRLRPPRHRQLDHQHAVIVPAAADALR